MLARGGRSRVDRFNRVKRRLDLAIVIVSAPVTLPVGVVLCVAAVFSSGIPVAYRQRRLGFQEREFEILKFRTMTSARDSDGRLLPDEERITRFGKFLRASSLDELPQLVNIFKGEMSFVGPRPLLVDYRDWYFEEERERHLVRPGITGLAQTEGRNNLLWPERLSFDYIYVRTASLKLDFRILARTVCKVLRRDNVSIVAGATGERLDVMRSYPRLDGISFRRLEAIDLPTRIDWFNNPRIREHMALPHNVNLQETREWWKVAVKDESRKDFVFYEIGSGKRLAMAGLREREDPNFPELYLIVNPSHQGRGVGKACLTLLHRWVAETDKYTGISLKVHFKNGPAVRLYESSGYETIAIDENSRIAMRWTSQNEPR